LSGPGSKGWRREAPRGFRGVAGDLAANGWASLDAEQVSSAHRFGQPRPAAGPIGGNGPPGKLTSKVPRHKGHA